MEELFSLIINLEEKCLSMKSVEKNLTDLIEIVCSRNKEIFEELNHLKTILNQMKESNQFDNKPNEIHRQSIDSPLSITSTSTNSLNQHFSSSNLKKSDEKLKRIQSPKSVTFSLDEINENEKDSHYQNNDDQSIIEKQSLENEKKQIYSDIFEEHHQNVTQKFNIGYQLGRFVSFISH